MDEKIRQKLCQTQKKIRLKGVTKTVYNVRDKPQKQHNLQKHSSDTKNTLSPSNQASLSRGQKLTTFFDPSIQSLSLAHSTA